MTIQITNDIILQAFDHLNSLYLSLFPGDIKPSINLSIDIKSPTDFTITSESYPDNYLVTYHFDLTDPNNPILHDSENPGHNDWNLPLDKTYQHSPISILATFFSTFYTFDSIEF